jgi:hypothetical protein
MSDEKV